jgi:hypothetical protein
MKVYVVKSGVVYEGSYIVAIYRSKEAAEKRKAKIEAEQAKWQKALQSDDDGIYERTKWSDTSSQDYAEISEHRLF